MSTAKRQNIAGSKKFFRCPHSFRIFGTIQILQRFPIQQIRNWSSTFFGSTVFWLSSSLYFHQVTHIYMYLGFVLLWVECKSFGKCRPRWRPPEAADAHTGDLTHSSSISNTKINVLENKPTLTTRGTGIKKVWKSPRAYQFDRPENLFIYSFDFQLRKKKDFIPVPLTTAFYLQHCNNAMFFQFLSRQSLT